TMAIVAGLVGSFVGGLLISLLAGDGLHFRPSGIIGSLVGAVIVTALWRYFPNPNKPVQNPNRRSRNPPKRHAPHRDGLAPARLTRQRPYPGKTLAKSREILRARSRVCPTMTPYVGWCNGSTGTGNGVRRAGPDPAAANRHQGPSPHGTGPGLVR